MGKLKSLVPGILELVCIIGVPLSVIYLIIIFTVGGILLLGELPKPLENDLQFLLIGIALIGIACTVGLLSINKVISGDQEIKARLDVFSKKCLNLSTEKEKPPETHKEEG